MNMAGAAARLCVCSAVARLVGEDAKLPVGNRNQVVH